MLKRKGHDDSGSIPAHVAPPTPVWCGFDVGPARYPPSTVKNAVGGRVGCGNGKERDAPKIEADKLRRLSGKSLHLVKDIVLA